jgi:hypothetical protein
LSSQKALLVGDNPFHNISHFSQERIRARDPGIASPDNAASLVITALENGANGFMFSVSETTLSILRAVRKKGKIDGLNLYAIVPYAYEYVTLATQSGGIPGLAKNLARQILSTRNPRIILTGLCGVLRVDVVSLMKTYVLFEMARVRSSAGKQSNLRSVLLHQVITDMALALNMDWLFKAFVDFMAGRGITPGFNTGNFVYLVNKFKEWDLDLSTMVIAAPFNKAGFQMNPSRKECEESLSNIKKSMVIAISIFAAGYLNPSKAMDYIATLPNVEGVAVGVSKENHARDTFKLLREKLGD